MPATILPICFSVVCKTIFLIPVYAVIIFDIRQKWLKQKRTETEPLAVWLFSFRHVDSWSWFIYMRRVRGKFTILVSTKNLILMKVGIGMASFCEFVEKKAHIHKNHAQKKEDRFGDKYPRILWSNFPFNK